MLDTQYKKILHLFNCKTKIFLTYLSSFQTIYCHTDIKITLFEAKAIFWGAKQIQLGSCKAWVVLQPYINQKYQIIYNTESQIVCSCKPLHVS